MGLEEPPEVPHSLWGSAPCMEGCCHNSTRGYGHVLSEQHGVEKQVLILTPRGEARTPVGHACRTSAQTPGTWCLPGQTHMRRHTDPLTRSLQDFWAVNRLIQAGFNCSFVFLSTEFQTKMSLGVQTHTAAAKQSRGCVGG